ncbi:protein kinase family protein [Photobacterium leiognathi]|uniref:hypothetical protein n=1 Tax=Photobacterium leiognathi TaxID=553611 RepID=UPI002981C44A|nr:hypothetical protein [Photobacterium leiognathi]
MSTRLCETASLELHVQSAVQQILTTMAFTAPSNSHSDRKNACIFQNKVTYTLYLLLQSFHCESQNTINKQCHYNQDYTFHGFDYVCQQSLEILRQSRNDFAIKAANRRGTITHITTKETEDLLTAALNKECEMVMVALAIQQLSTLINAFSQQENISQTLEQVFSRVLVNQYIDEGFQLSKQATLKLVEQISNASTGDLCQLILNQHTSEESEQELVQHLKDINTLAEHFMQHFSQLNTTFLTNKSNLDDNK